MIYAIVMAGGRGTRLNSSIEKPLFKLFNKPLIKHVLENISTSKLIDDVFIAISPHTPKTKQYVEDLNGQFNLLDTPGKDYINDLSFILDYFDNKNDDILLFINADLPFISGELIDYVLKQYQNLNCESLSVMTPISIFDKLGLSYSYNFNGLVPTGLNVLKNKNKIQSEFHLIIDKKELAFNINALEDAVIAQKFFKSY